MNEPFVQKITYNGITMIEITEPGSTMHNFEGKLVQSKTILCTEKEALTVFVQLGAMLGKEPSL